MFTIDAAARRYEPTQVWTEARARYVTRIANRKHAITWALRKIEREHPGFTEYEATITDGA